MYWCKYQKSYGRITGMSWNVNDRAVATTSVVVNATAKPPEVPSLVMLVAMKS